jgi:K+-transporting ATPase ATPase C chain
MIQYLSTAIRVTVISIVIFGFLYPFAMTGLAQAIFPAQANGSLVRVNGQVVGSEIIGQLWTKAYYFQGRPSAAGKNGYDPTATGGTNLGPTSKKLVDATRATIAALRKANPDATVAIPMDLVTSSGSGIDPDISPEGAYYQAPRIAKARSVSLSAVEATIARHVEPPTWGILGSPRVNVLALNLDLDRAAPISTAPVRPPR